MNKYQEATRVYPQSYSFRFQSKLKDIYILLLFHCYHYELP